MVAQALLPVLHSQEWLCHSVRILVLALADGNRQNPVVVGLKRLRPKPTAARPCIAAKAHQLGPLVFLVELLEGCFDLLEHPSSCRGSIHAPSYSSSNDFKIASAATGGKALRFPGNHDLRPGRRIGNEKRPLRIPGRCVLHNCREIALSRRVWPPSRGRYRGDTLLIHTTTAPAPRPLLM